MQGQIKTYNEDRAFGFILGEDGQDYFFHISNWKTAASLIRGSTVSFIPGESEKGKIATDIESIAKKPEFVSFGSERLKLSNIKTYGISQEYTECLHTARVKVYELTTIRFKRLLAKPKEPLNNSLCSVPTRCISRNLHLVKVISAQNSHYLSAFLLLFLKKGRLPPVSGYGEFSPGYGKRIQIGTSEHGVQSVLVFLQTTIHGFLVAELTLDDPERVLYFAAHRGFAVFNITLPVNRVVTDPGKTAGAAVNAEINF